MERVCFDAAAPDVHQSISTAFVLGIDFGIEDDDDDDDHEFRCMRRSVSFILWGICIRIYGQHK